MLREDFTYKLGRIEYSMTKYQKLIRVLIPVEYEDNKLEYTTDVERCLKKVASDSICLVKMYGGEGCKKNGCFLNSSLYQFTTLFAI